MLHDSHIVRYNLVLPAPKLNIYGELDKTKAIPSDLPGVEILMARPVL
jgi:hypothetical protein